MTYCVHIVGLATSSSIPVELAGKLARRELVTEIVSYYQPDFTALELIDQNLDITSIDAKRALDPRAVKKLCVKLTTIDANIVHVHHPITAALAALFTKMTLDALIVKTEHNDWKGYDPIRRLANSIATLIADLVICNSNATRNSIPQWIRRLKHKNLEVIYNGVDADRIFRVTRNDEESSATQLVVGSVGSLSEQKDYTTLLKAISFARDSLPIDTKVIIVGEGRLRAQLISEGEQLGISDLIEFHGHVGRDKVYKLLHRFDIFVMCSRWEGFCNAIVEAGIAGCDIVCSDIVVFHEVVGRWARYFPRGNADELARCLIEVATRSRDNEQRTLQQSWFTTRYGIDRTVDGYIKSYNRISNDSQ